MQNKLPLSVSFLAETRSLCALVSVNRMDLLHFTSPVRRIASKSLNYCCSMALAWAVPPRYWPAHWLGSKVKGQLVWPDEVNMRSKPVVKLQKYDSSYLADKIHEHKLLCYCMKSTRSADLWMSILGGPHNISATGTIPLDPRMWLKAYCYLGHLKNCLIDWLIQCLAVRV